MPLRQLFWPRNNLQRHRERLAAPIESIDVDRRPKGPGGRGGSVRSRGRAGPVPGEAFRRVGGGKLL